MQKKAFTLIELMVVVAIIGILAAIAVPNFVKFQCRSKQSEARGNLKAMYVANESYKAEFDSYAGVSTIDGQANASAIAAAGGNGIGFVPKGNRLRYQYSATALPATGTAAQFSGLATGGSVDSQEMAGDRWTVTDLNDVCNSDFTRDQPCNLTNRPSMALANTCD